MKKTYKKKQSKNLFYILGAALLLVVGVVCLLRGTLLGNAQQQNTPDAVSDTDAAKTKSNAEDTASEPENLEENEFIRVLSEEEKKQIRELQNKEDAGKKTVRKSGDVTYLSSFVGSDSLPDGMDTLIIDFMDRFYGCQMSIPSVFKSLEGVSVPDMTTYFEDPNGINAAIWQNALLYLIAAKTVNYQDMSYSSCEYSFTINNYTTSDGIYTLGLKENYVVSFAYLDGVKSATYGQECTFEICSVNGEWKVRSIFRDEDFFRAISNFVEEETTVEEIDGLCLNAFMQYCNNYRQMMKDKRTFNSEGVYFDVSYDGEYNREAAGDYAAQYATVRSTEYTDYETIGGNDQNYVSQCVLAGGMPMDVTGWFVWKYYGDIVDESPSTSGRTPSWVGPLKFYEYALYNKGVGMVATVGANFYSAECGDVLSVGREEDAINHSLIVIDVVKKGDEVLEVLLNANSPNRVNWPLAANFSYNVQMIKIHGYNRE